jgi:preprotein translocase subunit SecG
MPLAMNAPIIALSIILILASLVLTLAILIHKSRGGGMSDLFGGGMSTAFGGSSIAERNLDRITVVVGIVWLACIVALLLLWKGVS